MSASEIIDIFGAILTIGGGPLGGVGAPVIAGYGGSYGGSGGSYYATDGYFSNTQAQVICAVCVSFSHLFDILFPDRQFICAE